MGKDENTNNVSKGTPQDASVYTLSDYTPRDLNVIKTVLEKLDDLYEVRIQLHPLTRIIIEGFVHIRKKDLNSHDIDFINEVYPTYFPKESIYEIEQKIKSLKWDSMKLLNDSAVGYPHFKVVAMSRQMGKRRKLERLTQIHLEISKLQEMLQQCYNTRGVIR